MFSWAGNPFCLRCGHADHSKMECPRPYNYSIALDMPFHEPIMARAFPDPNATRRQGMTRAAGGSAPVPSAPVASTKDEWTTVGFKRDRSSRNQSNGSGSENEPSGSSLTSPSRTPKKPKPENQSPKERIASPEDIKEHGKQMAARILATTKIPTPSTPRTPKVPKEMKEKRGETPGKTTGYSSNTQKEKSTEEEQSTEEKEKPTETEKDTTPNIPTIPNTSTTPENENEEEEETEHDGMELDPEMMDVDDSDDKVSDERVDNIFNSFFKAEGAEGVQHSKKDKLTMIRALRQKKIDEKAQKKHNATGRIASKPRTRGATGAATTTLGVTP